MFIYRMQFGFRHLPFFLQPTLANDKDSKSELVFNVPLAKTKKEKKAKLIDEVEGLNSILDYQPTATNSYDSERLTWAFIDEGGKFPTDVPFSQFISIILETLTEGAERTGFGEFPSTVNELTKKGGAEFKKVWDDAVVNISSKSILSQWYSKYAIPLSSCLVNEKGVIGVPLCLSAFSLLVGSIKLNGYLPKNPCFPLSRK